MNGRLQWFTLDGEHVQTLDGVALPANVDTYRGIDARARTLARVTLLDSNNKIVARLGDDCGVAREGGEGQKEADSPAPRPMAGWQIRPPARRMLRAHGNIFIAEWVATGRITKLRKVS